MIKLHTTILLFILSGFTNSFLVSAQEFSGYFSSEWWMFSNDALSQEQKRNNFSLAMQPEFYYEWENNSSFTFMPFARFDLADSRRTKFDIRELNYLWVKDNWELTIGIDKVFWGVTEFVHLVDIVNQTDYVESIDGEEKLGQPMLHLSVPRKWGIVDLFVLPYFRERTFPGREGRLRFPIVIDYDNAKYESPAKKHHIDLAMRYSHYIGNWDFGISHFYGTSREPEFLLDNNISNQPVLTPYYELINQTGIDMQLVAGNWLFKLEAFYHSRQMDNFYAVIGGFEYTFTGFVGTNMDLGILGEWVFDDRGKEAVTFYDNDIIFGMRLGFNDLAGSSILLGISTDIKTSAQVGILEVSRRIDSNWKVSLTGRGFFNFAEEDIFYALRKDDFLRLEVAYYF